MASLEPLAVAFVPLSARVPGSVRHDPRPAARKSWGLFHVCGAAITEWRRCPSPPYLRRTSRLGPHEPLCRINVEGEPLFQSFRVHEVTIKDDGASILVS